jgi:hypothetical protein
MRSTAQPMSEVISIRKVRYRRGAARLHLLETMDAMPNAAASPDSGELTIVKLKVHRSILLLDLAAQHARVLIRQISDAPRRRNLESQISIIEQQLHVARQMASNI